MIKRIFYLFICLILTSCALWAADAATFKDEAKADEGRKLTPIPGSTIFSREDNG